MNKARASGSSGARREQVANACRACRASKVKCSGRHPTCARCSTRGIECTYDVSEEGMTKREHLRLELDGQRRELEIALTILDFLRHGTDQQAAEALARLRLGQTLEEAYEEIVNVTGWRRTTGEGTTSGEDHSTAQNPQPSPIDPALPSSSMSSSRYWPQPPNAPYTMPAMINEEVQQQQQQPSNWQSPVSPTSHSAASEWSNIGAEQFEQPGPFFDSTRHQHDDSNLWDERDDHSEHHR